MNSYEAICHASNAPKAVITLDMELNCKDVEAGVVSFSKASNVVVGVCVVFLSFLLMQQQWPIMLPV